MVKDLVYYFDKITYNKIELGEIQTDFNMGFTIDGTKDSAKVILFSYIKNVITPNTIIWHKKTDTWWIVSHDKVDRYPNENNTFVYKHELQLLGATELLNARDLTDCGFNQNTYTFEQFVERLFEMSNFEFSVDILTNGNIFLLEKIDYIKTYENYTLLSALREFLDGYNLVGKLTFNVYQNKLYSANLILVSKAGNTNSVVDEDIFIDNKENRNIDKNSYGTVVVSNAENVISTKAKTFPSTGAVKLSADANQITNNNALVRLPSNINKVNWVKLSRPTVMRINITYNGETRVRDLRVDANNKNELATGFENWANQVKDAVNDMYGSGTYYGQQAYNKLMANKSKITKPYIKGQTITMYSGWTYNPVSGSPVAPVNVEDFYFPYVLYTTSALHWDYTGVWVIAEKQVRDSLRYPASCLYYTRGDNIIRGFDFLKTVKAGQTSNQQCLISGYEYTDLRDATYNNNYIYWTDSIPTNVSPVVLQVFLYQLNQGQQHFSIFDTKVIVNYIPMSDLKIKNDNSGYDKDIHLYNQNGKLTDSVALSKLINSYSKEIESDNITKYGDFYDFDNIPQVGTIVNIDNDKYVINNVSMDFTPNENYEYYISCEFSLSKFVSTKSLMTNPNSNIRDYGIPQNNNVVRKQVYRDFYELEKTFDPNCDNTNNYLKLNKVLNIGSDITNYNEHVAVIKMTFDNAYGGDGGSVLPRDTWYYQLETTTFVLKKSIYEVVNFNDNNIIGYGSQNVSCGFDISRIFTGMTDLIATPISYVDDDGKVKGIDVCFTTNEQITTIYDKYVEHKNEVLGTSFTGSIYNYSVFIDGEIFEGWEEEIEQIKNYNSIPFEAEKSGGTYYGIVWFNDIEKKETQSIVCDWITSIHSDIATLHLVGGSSSVVIGFDTVREKYYARFVFTIDGTPPEHLEDLHPTISIGVKNTYNDIVNGAVRNNDFRITEENYKKDAIEVPFFEYGCQIDDSENVLVGENVFDNKESDNGYFYQWFLVPKGTANNFNFNNFDSPDIYGPDYPLNFDNACKMSYNNNNEIEIKIYESGYLLEDDNEVYYGVAKDFAQLDLENNDIVIIRNARNKDFNIYGPKNALMFVIQNPNEFEISPDNRVLYLKINHYRLK